MMGNGQLQSGPIITHEFTIDDICKAFAAADDKSSSGAIRVMVIP
jgi:threonine dehydrogenase-like Zn-dependent dehydrogenase